MATGILQRKFMSTSAKEILDVLDDCARAFTFPVMDNGYVYPAGTQLRAYADGSHWAISIQVLGYFSLDPSIGLFIDTFGSCLMHTTPQDPFHCSHAIWPIDNASEPWLDPREPEFIINSATQVLLRGVQVTIPQDLASYSGFGIELQQPPDVQPFELARYLAARHPDEMRATSAEMRAHVPSTLRELVQLEDWLHPDLAGGELPSETSTFTMLADALANNDVTRYRSCDAANTHWSNWPGGGTL